MLNRLKQWSPLALNALNFVLIAGSVVFCAAAMMARSPIMELTGIGPDWLLIWVVTWSVKRTALQGAIAGIFLGWIQDGLTGVPPSHALALAIVGVLTARIQKQRFIAEDFISVALIVFGMAVIAETIIALQLSWFGSRPLQQIWLHHRQVALSSAILSSLWAPAIYFPLNRWWQILRDLQQV
jgi:rod shape-determining protein MreD